MSIYRHYFIVIGIAVAFLALMRWRAVQSTPNLVDGSANQFILPEESHFKNLRSLRLAEKMQRLILAQIVKN